MDWHQFLDPQLVLGVGAFAFGLANAYVRRHFNRQAQTENTNQPEDETPGVSDATEESEPITSTPIESPDDLPRNATSPNPQAVSSSPMGGDAVEESVLAETHAPAYFSEDRPVTEVDVQAEQVSGQYWEAPETAGDASDEDFSDSSLTDNCTSLDSAMGDDHQARRRERRLRHKMRKSLSCEEDLPVDGGQAPLIARDGSVGTESDDSTLRAKRPSVVSTTTLEYAEDSPVLVTCLDDEERVVEEEEDREDMYQDMYQSVETMVGTSDAARETSPQETPPALISHPADAATLSQHGISSTMHQPLTTLTYWQPLIKLEPCLDRHLAQVAVFPIAHLAAPSLAVCEIQHVIQTDQSAGLTPGAVDHATDTYQLSTFREIFPHRLCPVSIAELPIGEEVFAVQEPKQSPAVDEGFLIKRQEEVLCVSEDPPEEIGFFAWVRPLEELSEGRLGEEVVWTQELVSQRPVEVTNSSDFQKAPVGSQQQTFQGDDVQAFDLVKKSRKVPDEASNIAEVLSEVSEPLCVEALKSSVRVLGEPLTFEKAHSYTSEDTGSRATENIVESGDLTNRKQLEQAVEESIVAVEKAPSTCSVQLTQKRVRFALAEVTEVWNDSDRVDSSYDKQSPPGKTSANQASFLPSDSHTLLPAEQALQFSVLETSVPIAEAEDTEESAHQFTPKVVKCSPFHATEDDHFGTTENQPSSDAFLEEKVEKTTAAAPVHWEAPVFPAQDNNFEVPSEDAQQLSSAKTGLDSADYPEGDYAALNWITENQTEEENSSDLSTDYIPEEPVTETCISCGLLPETLQHFVFDQPPNYSDTELNVSGTATGALWQTREHLLVSSEETALVSDLSVRGESPEDGKAVQSRAAEFPLANTLSEELAVISGRGDENPTSAMAVTHAALSSAAANRRRSFHFQFDTDSFDGLENLFTIWHKQSPVGRLFFASFSVDRDARADSPELLSVEEGERLECLDADNPDRWVIGRPSSGFSTTDSNIEAQGRGNAVCMLTHPPAKLSQSGNTREQFREEVLNISNKMQEASIKKKYALTEIIELEEGYAVRVRRLERQLASLTGNLVVDNKTTAFPAEMQRALEGLQWHLSATVNLSENLRAQLQMCAMNPNNAAQCFLDLEPKFAHYTAYLVHLGQLMNAYEKIGIKNQEVCFELTPVTETPPPSASAPSFNMDAKVAGGSDDIETRIGARQFLEQLFIPQAHLTSYESLLGYLARYSARSQNPTRELEAAMAVVRQASRRAVELQQLWPFVADMPSELGAVPPKEVVIHDLETLPKPLVRMTRLTVNRRKGGRLRPERNADGFLLLDPNHLIFLREQSEPADTPMYAVAWKTPLSDLRIRQVDQKEVENSTFELWDIGHSDDPIKSIIRVEAPNALSAKTWLQDLEKNIKSQGVNPFLDQATMEAHETADLESRKRYSQLVELDDWTEGENQFSELYYDVDDLVQSVNGGIYDSDIILHQLTSAEGDDETSLTYYTAEGSMQHVEATGNRKVASRNVRPASMMSADSVGTVDEVPNPFVEQKPDSVPEELTNEIVLTHSVSAAKPFEHHAELQNINSSEGGELELTISTSSSEDDAFTATWTFEGRPLSSTFGAKTEINGGNVTLGVPNVTKTQHEGRYECTLVWPSGMRAVFPFQVKVYPVDVDVDLTNDASKSLRVKTVEQASVKVTQQYDEEDNSDAGQGKGILLARKSSKGTLGVVEVTTVPDNTHVATASYVNISQHSGPSSKADVSTGAVKTYYATSTSVHSMEHDHAVPQPETVPETPTSAKPQVVQSTAQIEKAVTRDVDVKQHTAPQSLVCTEGDKLVGTLPVQLDGRTLRDAKVYWMKDGRTVATAGIPARTSNKNDFIVTVNQQASGEAAEVSLTKPICAREDAGEYVLWVEPKASRFGPKQEAKEWGRIRVKIEKSAEEEQEKENEPVAKPMEEILEDVELTVDSSADKDSKRLEEEGDKQKKKEDEEEEVDKVGRKKTVEEAEEKPERKKSSGEEQAVSDGVQSKTSAVPKEIEEAAIQPQQTAAIQSQPKEQKEEEIVPKARDEVQDAGKTMSLSDKSVKDMEAAEEKVEKPKKQASVTENDQVCGAERKVEVDEEKEGKKRKMSAERDEKRKGRKASRDEKTAIDEEREKKEKQEKERGEREKKEKEEKDKEEKERMEAKEREEKAKKEQKEKEEKEKMEKEREEKAKKEKKEKEEKERMQAKEREEKAKKEQKEKEEKEKMEKEKEEKEKMEAKAREEKAKKEQKEKEEKEREETTKREQKEKEEKEKIKAKEREEKTKKEQKEKEEKAKKEQKEKEEKENMEKEREEKAKKEKKEKEEKERMEAKEREEKAKKEQKENEEKEKMKEKEREEKAKKEQKEKEKEREEKAKREQKEKEEKEKMKAKEREEKTKKEQKEKEEKAKKEQKEKEEKENMEKEREEKAKKEKKEKEEKERMEAKEREEKAKKEQKEKEEKEREEKAKREQKEKEEKENMEAKEREEKTKKEQKEKEEKEKLEREKDDKANKEEKKKIEAKEREEKAKKEQKEKEEKKMVTEQKPVEASADTRPENLINLTVGEKFKLTALANLDAKQLKTANVYWTKDGKQLADLNFAPRAAAFTARSLPKPPRATEVDLVKRAAAEAEDSGTYCLMSEPKIKSIRNNKPTQHAVFQVVVVAPEPPTEAKEPDSTPEVEKVETSKETPDLITSTVKEVTENNQEAAAASTTMPDGTVAKPAEAGPEVAEVIANAKPVETIMDDLRQEEPSKEVAEVINTSEAAPTELNTDKEGHKVRDTAVSEAEEAGKKFEDKPKKEKKSKKHREKTAAVEGDEEKKKKKKVEATEDEIAGIDTTVSSEAVEAQPPPPPPPALAIRCVELDTMRMMGDASVVVNEGQPLCLTVFGLPENCENFQWTRNGTPIPASDANSQIRPPFGSPSHDGAIATQLLVKAATPDDTGVYELTAASSKSPSEDAVRITIPVDVKQLSTPDSERPTAPKPADDSVLQLSLEACRPVGLTPHEGDPLVLAADLKVPFEQVRPDVISWTHNGVAVEDDDNTRMALKASPDGDFTSIILQRAAVSFKDAGTYRIRYRPQIIEPILEVSSSEETSRETSPVDLAFPKVVVISEASKRRRSVGHGKETRRPQPPQLIKALPGELNLTRGDTVTLEAETVGDETVVPVWLFNGREIDPGRTRDYVIWHSGTYFALTIPAVDARHLGNYELHLIGADREIKTSCQLGSKSMVAEPQKPPVARPVPMDGITPMFTKKLSDVECESGEEIWLTCRVVGDPLPHLLWRHNDRYLEGSDDRHSIKTRDNTSTLVIRAVEPSDRGVYVCSAANEFGKSQTSAQVIVDGRVSPFEEQEDLEGEMAFRLSINRTLSLPRAAPDGLMVERSTPEELKLSWSPLPDPDITYTIEVSKDNGRWWQPVLTGIRETSAVLPPEHSYPLQSIQVRLLAENSNGTGPPSMPALRIPARACVPQMASVKPILKPADLGSVLITWPDNLVTPSRDMRDVSATGHMPSTEPLASSEALGNLTYSVEVREGARGEWKEVARGLKERSYVHHLKPGVSTMVRLRASNQFGTSEPSPTAIANLPQEDLVPDMSTEAPWVSVIRPDLNKREGVLSAPGDPVTAGLMLHWKPAYLPEYCSRCVSGLEPVYRIEWRKSRTGPWLGLADDIVGTDCLRLPSHVIRALAEQQAAQPSSLRGVISSNPIEVRVVCHNDYGSTLPTKSVRLSGLGLFKSAYEESGHERAPLESSLTTLPILSPPEGKPKLPLYLTSTDLDEGICLGWEDAFRASIAGGNETGGLHGKYRLESCVVPRGAALDAEDFGWRPVGPLTQPILGSSYCLDLKPHVSMEQRVRLLALTSEDSGKGTGWINAYEQVRIPCKRQLLPTAVDSLNAQLVQNPDATFSVKLGWLPVPLPEGEDMLEAQLAPSIVSSDASAVNVSYRIEVQDGASAYGGWRQIGTVVGREQTSFLHKSPSIEAQLSYRVTPFNKYGDGPSSVVPAVSIPKRLSELQGCVEDLRILILGPREISLRWRLGDTALDTLEQMGRRKTTSGWERGRLGGGGMSDSGYALSDDDVATEELRMHVHFSVERRDAYGGEWYTVDDRIPGGLTGKVVLDDCPREMHGSEYRITAWLNGQPCAPSRPARISVKAAELAPDMSYQKPAVDTSNVGEYHISWQDNDLESLYSRHVLAATLPQSLEKDLTYEVQVLKDSSRDWETLVTDLTSPSWTWSGVDPLLPYSVRVIGRNQFGAGQPSRATHVDAQVVIPDLSFVIPVVREPSGILEGREPAELRWQLPRAYTLNNTLTPFTYEVQVRPVGADWSVLASGLKVPHCQLNQLEPDQEYALRVVAVTEFGRGKPSQVARKRRGRGDSRSVSLAATGYSTDQKAAPPAFEDPAPSVIYLPLGADLDLHCSLTSQSMREPVRFVWSFNFQPIPDDPKLSQFPMGYFQGISVDGRSAQLRLADISEHDLGTYTCKAMNRQGSSVKEFRVLRADAPVITEVPPPIVTLSLHQTLLLPCWVDAIPPAKVTWTRDSRRITSSYRTQIGGEAEEHELADEKWTGDEKQFDLTRDASLRVDQCIFQDAGLYTMVAENPAGRAQISCIVRVEDNPIPKDITPRWTSIDRHYFVLSRLSTGSFSRSHLLIDKQTNREYVGKIYELDDLITRVLGAREVECLGRMHHSNIVELVDAVVSDNHLILITERLCGNHLLEEIQLAHSWSEAAVALLVRQILEAVAHMHSQGVVHLDIQPENIIFPRAIDALREGMPASNDVIQSLASLTVDSAGADGRCDFGVVSSLIRLTGFSMAQPIFDRDCLQPASILPPLQWCADFAAPELIRMADQTVPLDMHLSVGCAADIWSIGMVTYLLLSGGHPTIHQPKDQLQLDELQKITSDLENREGMENVSPEALDFLRQLLTFDSRDRPTAVACLRHPWLTETDKASRNLEPNLPRLHNYHQLYQQRKTLPTDVWRTENFLKFAGEACELSLHRGSSKAPSTQPGHRMGQRDFSIDRELTERIASIMLPPEERGVGSEASSTNSSLLNLDTTGLEEGLADSRSPRGQLSPPPAADPWAGFRESRIPGLAAPERRTRDTLSPSQIFSSEDSSSATKRFCEQFAEDRMEAVAPVGPQLHSADKINEFSAETRMAPAFATPLRDSHIDPRTGEAFFACQLAGVPRLPFLEAFLQRGNKEALRALLPPSSGDSRSGEFGAPSTSAAAWYLGGCLLSDGPGISLGTAEGGWLWMRLDSLNRNQAGKTVECVVRNRAGKARTRARILLPEPPREPGRPGVIEASAKEVIVAWASGNNDCCEDLIYKVDLKYPDEKPATSWRTVGFTADCRFLIPKMLPNTNYRVRVSVRNAAGWSGYSIASSEFKTASDPTAKCSSISEDETAWMLCWRQSTHPFGLSDHPEALLNRPLTASSARLFETPPAPNALLELQQFHGLFASIESVNALCSLEGLISWGHFEKVLLLRCHPALVERIPTTGQNFSGCLPAYVVARISQTKKAGPDAERRARQRALAHAYLNSSAGSRVTASPAAAESVFSQQFASLAALLPVGLSLGWLADDAARPTAGISVCQWAPGGRLLDVLRARGEYTEFSIARWTYQLLMALRWLYTALRSRLHGCINFDTVLAVKRVSSLPDIMLAGFEPVDEPLPAHLQGNCFVAPEKEEGEHYSQSTDLWSAGVFAYLMMTANVRQQQQPATTNENPQPATTGDSQPETTSVEGPDAIRDKSGYKRLSRPTVNLKLIKNFSKWAKRFVYNTLQFTPANRGSLEFWLDFEWFSLRPEVVKQLASTTIPSHGLLNYRPAHSFYGYLPCDDNELSLL